MNHRDDFQHNHTGSASLAARATETLPSGRSQTFLKATWIDPMCGMTVGPSSPHRAEHAGPHFRFCSAGCSIRFLTTQSSTCLRGRMGSRLHSTRLRRRMPTERPVRFTRAQCTPKSDKSDRDTAPSAA